MQTVRGIYLPDGDEHLRMHIENGPMVAGKGTYQIRKYIQALQHVHDFRHAIDIGAHVGLWSRVMATWFSRLTAFEPLQIHRDCFVRNLPADSNVRLFDCALGDKTDVLRMHVKGGNGASSASSYIQAIGKSAPTDEVVRVAPLDTFDLGDEVDFIKIDCEGFELAVIKGGENLIRRNKPTIVVEQKPGNAQRYGFKERAAVELLRSWGANLKDEIGGDFIMRWKIR